MATISSAVIAGCCNIYAIGGLAASTNSGLNIMSVTFLTNDNEAGGSGARSQAKPQNRSVAWNACRNQSLSLSSGSRFKTLTLELGYSSAAVLMSFGAFLRTQLHGASV